MKYILNWKLFVSIIIQLHFVVVANAQQVTNERLLGCWQIKSINFLEPNADSVAMKSEVVGMISCFEKGGKFTTKIVRNNIVTVIGTGTYSIRPDGKTLDQQSDEQSEDSVDETAEVIMETNKSMLIKLKELILQYERM